MKCCIFEHDIQHDGNTEEFYDASYDIDLPIDTVQVNATNFQGPRLPYEQWHALPEDAKKIWDMLSPDAKTIILCLPPKPDPNRPPKHSQKPSSRQQNALPACRSIQEHDIDYITACLHELHKGGGHTTNCSCYILQ